MSDEHKAKVKQAIALLDEVMEQAPSRQLADPINQLQALVEK